MVSFTIKPMLDEEDNGPVFEVSQDGVPQTNLTTLEDALAWVREGLKPHPSLESIAEDWVKSHGVFWYDSTGEEIQEELEIELTPDQLDILANMVQSATVTVQINAGM